MNNAEVLIKFKADDSDVNAKTKELSSNIGSKLASAAKVGAAAMTAVGVAAGATAKAFWDGVSASAKYGDEIDKQSQKLNISAENYQALDYALQRSGSSIDSVSKGMKTIVNDLGEFASGSAEAGSKYEALGISMTNADGSVKSSEQILLETIDALGSMEDETMRNAYAQDIFGRSAAELTPLLNQGAEGISDLMTEAKDYGIVMGNDAVKASAAFQDSLTKLKGTFGGVKNAMMSEFMPGITTVMDGFSDLLAGVDGAEDKINEGILQIGDKISKNLPKIVNAISKIMPSILQVIGDIIKAIAKTLLDNLPTIIKAGMDLLISLTMGIIEMMPELIPVIIECILTIVQALLDNIDLLINGAIQLMLGLIQGILNSLPLIISKMPQVIEAIVIGLISALPQIFVFGIQLVGTLLEGIMSVISSIPEAFINNFTAAWEGIKQVFGAVANFFGNIFGKAWEKVKNVFSVGGKIFDGIKDGIAKVFKNVVNTIIRGINTVVAIPFNAINSALRAIKGVNIAGVAPFSWLPTISVPKIPLLNVGTNYVPEDQLAMIHKGEAVIPKKFNPYANGLNASTLGAMQNGNLRPIINVYADFETDPIGQTVSNIKTFSGGARNDYNYGMGV